MVSLVNVGFQRTARCRPLDLLESEEPPKIRQDASRVRA